MLEIIIAIFMMSIFSNNALANDEIIVGAIGDSLSTGFNARRLGDNREFSWSTGNGSGLTSQSTRIARKRKAPVITYNEAIAGSKARDLHRQSVRLLRHNPNYVTITIGANDICTWDSDYTQDQVEFKKTLIETITKIVRHSREIKIILIPIPDLYNVWEISHNIKRCQEIWDTLQLCQPLLGKANSIQERIKFIERWKIANMIISEVANSFPDQIRFQPELANTKFEWSHLSPKDCFHPSIEGQNLMSEIAWQKILVDD